MALNKCKQILNNKVNTQNQIIVTQILYVNEFCWMKWNCKNWSSDIYRIFGWMVSSDLIAVFIILILQMKTYKSCSHVKLNVNDKINILWYYIAKWCTNYYVNGNNVLNRVSFISVIIAHLCTVILLVFSQFDVFSCGNCKCYKSN